MQKTRKSSNIFERAIENLLRREERRHKLAVRRAAKTRRLKAARREPKEPAAQMPIISSVPAHAIENGDGFEKAAFRAAVAALNVAEAAQQVHASPIKPKKALGRNIATVPAPKQTGPEEKMAAVSPEKVLCAAERMPEKAHSVSDAGSAPAPQVKPVSTTRTDGDSKKNGNGNGKDAPAFTYPPFDGEGNFLWYVRQRNKARAAWLLQNGNGNGNGHSTAAKPDAEPARTESDRVRRYMEAHPSTFELAPRA